MCVLLCNLKNGWKPVKIWLYANPGFFMSREAERLPLVKPTSSQSNFHLSDALRGMLTYDTQLCSLWMQHSKYLQEPLPWNVPVSFGGVGMSSCSGLCLLAARWGACREPSSHPELQFPKSLFNACQLFTMLKPTFMGKSHQFMQSKL